jgi:hypothetical protein
MRAPLCFVLMPFGVKPDPAGRGPINFDTIYSKALEPAIRAAGLEPIRADAEVTGGIIHKPMFERLILCDFALADLTTANAIVFYELGIRHAARPSTTLAVYAKLQPLPFDVNLLRTMPYELAADNTLDDARAAAMAEGLTKRLRELVDPTGKQGAADSPLFQLLGEFQPARLARDKTDVFRDEVAYSQGVKSALATARSGRDAAAVAKIRADLGRLDQVEAGVLVDLFLTYRSFKDWTGMIGLYEEMPPAVKGSILVREQLGMALNRRAGKDLDSADRRRALDVLGDVLRQQGPSSETCGLIGRVYKDLWELHVKGGDDVSARGYLRKAIASYRQGFEADPRDAYPGINLLTMLEMEGSADSLKERDRMVPIVRYAAERRVQGGPADYWDHATLLEIEVLGSARERAEERLADAVALIREPFEPETTARNLSLIRDARAARGTPVDWLQPIITALDKKGAR